MQILTSSGCNLAGLLAAGWTALPVALEPAPAGAGLPLFSAGVSAGFPSPAQDHEESRLDLNELVIIRPEATFLLRVQGDSMRDANINNGDIVVVDRSIQARHGHVVIAEVGGGFTIKTLWKRGGHVRLVAANPSYSPIEFPEGESLTVFGVVTWILHRASP